MTASNQSHRAFATTRWATITQIVGVSERTSSDALSELCTRYRYPVYAYVRRCGHAPAIALDITGSFLDHLQRNFRNTAPPTKQYFRSFLLARLHAYLAEDWRKTRDEATLSEVVSDDDLEARYLRHSTHAGSPEQEFQRGFAMEVLSHSFARLRAEARQTGHIDMYEALAPFIAHDPGPGQYDELARTLRTRPLSLVVALKRLRQRLRELATDELADTVSSAEELDVEQLAMFGVLQGQD